MSVINSGKFYYLKHFCSFLSPSLSGIPVTPMLYLLQFPHNSYIFCSVCVIVVVLFSLRFSLGSLYWHIFMFIDSSIGRVPFTDEPIKDFISLVLLISSISFLFFLKVSISVLPLPIYSCMLSTLFIKGIDVLIRVVSDFLSDNSNICITSESDSDA